MEETKRKKQKQVLLILLGLLLLLSGWLVYRYYLQAKPEPVTIVSGEFLPAGKDAQKISDSEKKKMAQVAVDKSKFNLVISPEAKIDRQTGSGELMIKNVTLEQALEKGEYPSVALFSLYDPDTNEKKGQVAAGVTLTVE